MDADTILREAAERTNTINDPRDRMASHIGSLTGYIRELCADIEAMQTAEGIADAIGKLDATKEAMSAVLTATAGLVDTAENDGAWDGMDMVALHLENACDAMSAAYPTIRLSEAPERNAYDDSRDFARAA